MSRVTLKEWYSRVNAAWPESVPVLTAAEQVHIARRMYRFIVGATWSGSVRLTSGNRYSWIRNHTLIVNPEIPIDSTRGLVHLLSHKFTTLTIRGGKPHGADHARIELRMIKEIVKRGYLTGALKKKEKPAKPVADPQSVKYARILAGIDRWQRKAKRAETALKKLRRRAKHYERAAGAQSATLH